MWHSKTVPYDRLRTSDVNNIYNDINYKNVIALFSKKADLQNHLRMAVVERSFSSSVCISMATNY